MQGREAVFLGPIIPCCRVSTTLGDSLLHQTVYLPWQTDSPSWVDLWPKTRQQAFHAIAEEADWALLSQGYGLWLGSTLFYPGRNGALEKVAVLMHRGKGNGPCLSWIQPFLMLSSSFQFLCLFSLSHKIRGSFGLNYSYLSPDPSLGVCPLRVNS